MAAPFVVDSTNFKPDSALFVPGGENLHLIEKFTRVDPETLKYEVTINDPSTFTKPWTAVLFMKKSKDQIYEYACHEGNLGLEHMLSAARAADAARK